MRALLKMSSMELIKKLRDTTGSGIVDCKKALFENNNDIAEIHLNFNGEDIGLHLKDVSDTDPPIFTLDSIVDFKIECDEEDKYELIQEIVLCIRYEETIKVFSLGNINRIVGVFW